MACGGCRKTPNNPMPTGMGTGTAGVSSPRPVRRPAVVESGGGTQSRDPRDKVTNLRYVPNRRK